MTADDHAGVVVADECLVAHDDSFDHVAETGLVSHRKDQTGTLLRTAQDVAFDAQTADDAAEVRR